MAFWSRKQDDEYQKMDEVIQEQPGIRQAELARELEVSRSTVTRRLPSMDEAGYLGFNLHNQYLEYFLKFGLIGLIYFLTILFLSFQKAIKDRNGLYFSFLIIFCMFSITESNLEVQRGIVFFVLINSLFYFFPEVSEQKAHE